MTALKMTTELWVEYYRPTELKHIVLPKRIKDNFTDGLTQNYLFAGTHGTGKTTLAKILAKNHSILFINGSEENGIDIVRSKIKDFVSVGSLVNRGKKKVVLIDEADNFTVDAQKSLRAFIEQYHRNALFILTANYPERIIEPLHSRFNVVSFDFTDEEQRDQMLGYIEIIRKVLKHNGFEITDDALKFLIKTKYPDLRKILGDLQSIAKSVTDRRTIELSDVTVVKASAFSPLHEFLCTEHDPTKIYQFVKSNFMNKELQAMKGLGSDFLSYLEHNGRIDKVLAVSVIVHKYNFEIHQSIDKLITLLACCAGIADILRK